MRNYLCRFLRGDVRKLCASSRLALRPGLPTLMREPGYCDFALEFTGGRIRVFFIAPPVGARAKSLLHAKTDSRCMTQPLHAVIN